MDTAGTNIKKGLLRIGNWTEINTLYENPVYKNNSFDKLIMITIKDNTIKHENIEHELKQILKIKPCQVIYISRHRSKSGEPTLTTHPIGNYGEAKFGGKSRKLTPSSPRLMTQLLKLIKKNTKIEKTYHQVCFEVTHHGPYLSVPTLFTEVGSNQDEWEKEKPAEIIAKSLIELFNNYQCEQDLSRETPVIIGIGGGHYAPRFTEIALSKNVAFGHMIPNYQIESGNINETILKHTLETTPNVEGVYFDKKALKKSQVTAYKKWFQDSNIRVVSSKELKDL